MPDCPLLSDSNVIDYIEVSEHIKADFCRQVTGDSMKYIGIHESDTALFRKRESAQNGQVVAARKIDGNKVYFESRVVAVNAGYVACKVCRT